MEKKIKYLIIIASVIVLIIVIIILIMKNKIIKDIPDYDTLKKQEEAREEAYKNPVYLKKGQLPEKTRNASVFFTIDACIQKYLEYIKNNDNSAVYDLLDSEYINDEKISNNNVIRYVNEYNNEKKYQTKLVYTLSGNQYVTYFVKAQIDREDVFYVVNTDLNSHSFSIRPVSSEYFSKKLDEPVEQDTKNEKSINLNKHNALITVTMHDEDICRKYLKYYNRLLLNDSDEAYRVLDSNYREERFPNKNEFNKYIQERKDAIEKAYLEEYAVDSGNEKTKYTIKDSYQNYYLLEEDSIMDFTIKLDAYTIPNEEFLNKYKSLKEAEKASANIGIFIQMINNKDYTHAYKKLSNGFRNNYFKTQEEFENYIKSNWYNVNSYKINSYKNEGDIYIYDISLSNPMTLRDSSTIDKTINIRLDKDDDKNYEISFNV